MTRRAVFQQIVLTALKFLSAHSILLPPASAAPYRYTPKGHHQNMTPGMSAVDGTGGILTDFLIRYLTGDTNLKSRQVQSEANDIRFVICDETPGLSYKIENFTQCTGNPVPWVNVAKLSGTTMIISMHCGNSVISIRQTTGEIFQRKDLLYSAIDLRGVIDAGMTIRKELE